MKRKKLVLLTSPPFPLPPLFTETRTISLFFLFYSFIIIIFLFTKLPFTNFCLCLACPFSQKTSIDEEKIFIFVSLEVSQVIK